MAEMTIAQTKRLFIKIQQVGQCDERGRAVFAAGYGKKWVADEDKPIRTLVLPVMQTLLDFARYSNREAFEADVAALRKYVDGLHPQKGGKPIEE